MTTAGALAAVGLLRAARGYRPFPSIDDFAYLPMAFARLDQQLYPRDVLLRETPLHMSLMSPLVAVLESTSGLELGFWLITVLLSILTVLSMYRWMRALGLPGALVPLAAALACAGQLQGLGRGAYDGVFGDAFHFQWAAICALLWAYDALLRAQRVRTASFLALASMFHPVVGIHGAVAIAFGLAFARGSSTRARTWLVPATAGTCAFVVLLASFPIRGLGGDGVTTLPEAAGTLVLRTNEYDIDPLQILLLMVLVAAAVSSLARVQRRRLGAPIAVLLGLLTGHVALVAAECLLYEAHVATWWSTWTVLPFQLSLSRTTPVLLTLSSVAVVTGLEEGFLQSTRGEQPLRGPRFLATRVIQVAATVCLAVAQMKWSWPVALCCATAAVSAMSVRQRTGYRALTAIWAIAAIGGIFVFSRSAPLGALVQSDQEQLYRWARSSTRFDALFIVPPSFQEFRFYTRRSVYVDFKTMTQADFRLVLLWRRRLEQVSAPDGLALTAHGWDGVPEWDRTYAGRNTPKRIGALLRETGADYLVWDRQGLRVPPFVDRDESPDPDVTIAFENDRYKVYQRGH